MSPKLAIVCREAAGFGGISRHILEHSVGLTRAGWEVTVFAERLDRAALEGVGATCETLTGIPWGSWLKRRWFAAMVDRRLEGFELIHGHGDNFRHDIMSLHNCVHAAHEAIYGRPLEASNGVGRIHAAQLTAARFKTLICNSRQTADEAARRFGVPRERIAVIYPGYDPLRFKAGDRARLGGQQRAQLGWGQEPLVIGLVTSGDFIKRGVSTFLEALARVKKAGVRFKAAVVGKESRLASYVALAEKSGLKDTVRFLPAQAEVERYYHMLDIYVHPALYEEFGQSVEEALACGLPAIVGKRVGASELLSGAMREFIVEPTADLLAAAIARLAGDEDLRRRIAAMGPGCVMPHTWASNVAATQQVYAAAVRREKR